MAPRTEELPAMQVKIPKIGTVIADNVSDLISRVRAAIDENSFGASDVGARWVVKDAGKKVGMLSYNGRFEEQTK
jgi:hypothetical protein